jgi:hypothetical protein
VFLDPVNDFRVEDPMVMPRSKWVSDWMGRTPPSSKTYWVLPKYIDHVTETAFQKSDTPLSLLLPEKMLGGIPISDIESLIIRTYSKPYPMPLVLNPGCLEVAEVLDIRVKPKLE